MTRGRLATIERITLIEYSSNGSKSSSNVNAPSNTNIIVRLNGRSPAGELVGLGECQLRKATGDDPENSWIFLCQAVKELEGSSISLTTRSAGIDDVRLLMNNIKKQAIQRAKSSPSGRTTIPFRGSLLGIELGLLDLTAKGLGTSLAKLLGTCRDQISIAPPSHSLDTSNIRDIAEKVRRRKPDVFRLSLTGDVATDLRLIHELASNISASVPWWLEGKCAYSFEHATELVKGLAKGMRRRLFHSIILEQPVGASRRDEMAELQRRADSLGGRLRSRNLNFRIMADESLSGMEELAVLTQNGGCRALNIKPGRVGGLLAAIDIVRQAIRENSDTTISLSSMAPTSDISDLATLHLGLALPRLDYYARARSNDIVKVAATSAALSASARVVGTPSGEGLGAGLKLESVIPCSGQYWTWPESDGPLLDHRKARSYPEERHTKLLTKSAMRSHLVEREALAHGLEITRYNPTFFVARGDQGSALVFGARARSSASSAASFVIADKHKGAAHALLERAGVPVPASRLFKLNDLDSAVAYASEVGYPVVSKPVGGTGGAAVTTNIGDARKLAEGFEAVRRSPRYRNEEILVQRHIRGDVYRVMVIDDRVTAALMRLRPFVTGDGRRSIGELIVEKNAYRRDNPRLRKGLISVDRSQDSLQRRNLSLDVVPPKGEHVTLGEDAYLNGGGDSIDVLQELHPSIAGACIEAVRAVPGLAFCGVDIVLEDHRMPIDRQDAGVCELNSCPELITPQFPLFGEPQPVARQLLVRAAAGHGVFLSAEPAQSLTVEIEISGCLTSKYSTWLSRLGRDLGLAGWVAPSGTDRVVAVAAGPTVAVSVLTSMAIAPPSGLKPATVKARPCREATLARASISPMNAPHDCLLFDAGLSQEQ